VGMGDWGLLFGPNPLSPIPNPQSPIPNPQFFLYQNIIFKLIYIIKININKYINKN